MNVDINVRLLENQNKSDLRIFWKKCFRIPVDSSTSRAQKPWGPCQVIDGLAVDHIGLSRVISSAVTGVELMANKDVFVEAVEKGQWWFFDSQFLCWHHFGVYSKDIFFKFSWVSYTATAKVPWTNIIAHFCGEWQMMTFCFLNASNRVRVWNTATWQQLATWPGRSSSKTHQPSSRSFAANSFPSKLSRANIAQVRSGLRNCHGQHHPGLDRRPMNCDFTWRKPFSLVKHKKWEVEKPAVERRFKKVRSQQ